MKWSQKLDDEEVRGITIAHKGKTIAIDALELEPRIIITEAEEVNEIWGIQVVVKCDDVELFRETQWGIGLNGDPNESPDREFLDQIIASLIPILAHEAHRSLYETLDITEHRLKTLKEVRNKLSTITLEHGSNRLNLTLNMAQNILLIKWRDRARDRVKPYRLHLEFPNVAVVYDEQNRVMGRIGFDPTVEKHHNGEGRFGLFNLPD